MLFAQSGVWPRARELYREAIEADPSYRTRYNHAGPSLWEAGLRREAADSYALMSRLDPEHPDYRFFEFERRLAARDWRAAAEAGGRLFSEGCVEHDLILGLAECQIALGRHDRGLHWLASCDPSRLKPYAVQRYWLLKAAGSEALGRRADAFEAHQNVVRVCVRAPLAHLSLAKHYLRRGNLYKARRHAWKAFRHWER